MKSLSTLRSRLLVSYLGLILIGFGGLTLFAGEQIKTIVHTDFSINLRTQALLIASILGEPIEHEMDEKSIDQNVLQLLLERYALDRVDAETEVDILFGRGEKWVNRRGSLSKQAVEKMTEIDLADNIDIAGHIRPNDQGIDIFYTAAPIVYETETLGYVQLGKPASILQGLVRQRLLPLVGSFIAFSVVGIFICLWLISSLTSPLSHLRDTALEMADGDLSQRVASPKEDEIGEVGKAFNQMADQVEAMVAEQRAFASNASHELRTPLTTIRLRTEWLLSGLLDETTSQQYVQEIDQEINRMGGLVDDLILLSRLDAHRLEIGQEQIDPMRLMQKVQRESTLMAESKGITLTLKVPDKAIPPIQANMNHLHVVFRNLVENALKYTQQAGSVAVTLTNERDFLQFQVVDNGRGIAPEDLPHLTQRFYRADKAHSRKIDGVGLGLALVQSTVELYGGRFQITSDGINQGTTAAVWWPFSQSQELLQGSVNKPIVAQISYPPSHR